MWENELQSKSENGDLLHETRAEQQRRVWSLTVWLSQQAFQSAHYDWSEKKRTITHSRLLLMSTCWIKSRLWNWNFCMRRRAHTEAKSASFPGKHRPARAPVTKKSDHVRKKWKRPEGWVPSLFPLSNFLSPLISSHLNICDAPACLGLICCGINFKCLLALKARQ